MKKIKVFYNSARAELAKVVRPTFSQVKNAFVSVLIVVSVITLFLALIDWILAHLVASVL